MITPIKLSALNGLNHMQFVTGTCDIFRKHNAEPEILSGSYEALYILRDKEEAALSREKNNEKILEKNMADLTRERKHSSLFNYSKSILYDDDDPRRDAAQRIMNVITEAGNPSRLAENNESALLTTLGNKLEACGADLDTTGARSHVDKLIAANNRFIELEKECRSLVADKRLADEPSLTALRKQTDPLYRSIIDTLNALIKTKGKAGYENLIVDMNVLIEKYNKKK
jgi:hypothetical protein